MRSLSCISVPEVVGLLLRTYPVYFMDTVNFIGDSVSLVIILVFIEPFSILGTVLFVWIISLTLYYSLFQ